MKRIIKNLTLFLALIFATVCFAACDNGLTKGGSARGASDIDIGQEKFVFIKAEDYDAETFDIETAHKWTDLDVDIEYYLILTVDVTSVRDNDGQSMLNVNITFDELDIMEGTIEEAGTGHFDEMTFTNAKTGKIGKTSKVSFKISPRSAEPKTINMIIRLKPVKAGEGSHIIIGYDFEPSTSAGSADDYKMTGGDGQIKYLKVNAVQIAAPVLETSLGGYISWNHVKNADYYMVYEVGKDTPIRDLKRNEIQIPAASYSVGDPIMYNIGEWIVAPFAMLHIRAFSNNSNILPSSYSNTITFEAA